MFSPLPGMVLLLGFLFGKIAHLSLSPWQTIGHAKLWLTATCAIHTNCIGLHSWSAVSIDFPPEWDYSWHPMHQKMSVHYVWQWPCATLVLAESCCVVLLGQLQCIHPWHPLDTLLSEGCLLSWYSILDVTWGLLGNWKLIYSSASARQVNHTSRFKWAHKKLCDLFCKILRQVAWTALFIFIFMACRKPATRLLSLILLWHCLGRGLL